MHTRTLFGGAYLSGALLGGAIAVPGTLPGQEANPAGDTLSLRRIEGITVTVGRDEVQRTALPRQIEVITRTDLARTPAEGVAQLLKKRATVDVIEYPGLLSGIGIRGFRPQFSGINQRTLVLVDGRPAGATNLSLLDLRTVERVEVLKGPASALYGSNAMGGVVNLITRRSTGPIEVGATAGYGSWSTRQGSARAGGSLTGDMDFDLSIAAFERGDDYRVGGGDLFQGLVGDTAALRIFPDSVVVSPELGVGEVRPFTQYGTRSGSARIGYSLGGAWRADARLEAFRADRVQSPADLFFTFGDGRSLKNVARTSGDLALSGTLGRHGLTGRVFAAVEGGENYNRAEAAANQPQFINLNTWNRWEGLQLQDALKFGAQTVIAGMDYTRARAESERFSSPTQRVGPYEPDSEITSGAAFAEGRFHALGERLVATLGGRLDRIRFQVHGTEIWDGGVAARNDETFTVFNPSAGLQYTFPAGLRLHGGGGRAFVTPTAFNVAGRVDRRAADGGVHLVRGNPDLDPENSITAEIGAGVFRAAKGLDADATYFRTRVRDRITALRTTPVGQVAPDGSPIRSHTTYVNADEAEMEGIEWRLAYDVGRRTGSSFVLRPFVNATHMLRAEETVGTVTRDIRNVADLTVNFGIDFDDLRRFGTRLSGRYVGERTDDDYNVFPAAELRYPAFLTLDWSGEARIAERLRLGLTVSNLTDEYIYEIRGYPLPGRAVQLHLSVDL